MRRTAPEPVRLSTPPIPDWQEQLQSSLRRAQDAISRGVTQQEEMVRAWTESLRTAYPDWGRERWQRRLERKLRRRAEREARIANASLFEGYLWLLGAIQVGRYRLAARRRLAAEATGRPTTHPQATRTA